MAAGEFWATPITDPALFIRALTHGSTGEADFQRLEFLGDRVLGLVSPTCSMPAFPMNQRADCRTG